MFLQGRELRIILSIARVIEYTQGYRYFYSMTCNGARTLSILESDAVAIIRLDVMRICVLEIAK